MIVHLTPSILNGWEELRNVDENTPSWVNPDKFKESVMGVFTPSVAASAGNACSVALFEDKPVHHENGWQFTVGSRLQDLKSEYPDGLGVAEATACIYLPREFQGNIVRIVGRADYLSTNFVTEMKTSSRGFGGKTRSYLESMQAFSYMYRWKIPIKYLFIKVDVEQMEKDKYHVNIRDMHTAMQYPSEAADAKLFESVESLIPYLQSDEEMWHRVTNRKEPETV